MGGAALAETFREQKAEKAKRGKTVDEIIDERIDVDEGCRSRSPTARCGPGSKAGRTPRATSTVSSDLGSARSCAGEVTKHDIATLSNDIVAGKFGVPSVSNARHMRKAVSGLFNWAAEAGRDYVTASPCVNLPKLDPEHPRTRVLSEDEIRIFWHGLDRDDLPWDRKTRLALKFELVTMLRSGELLAAHRERAVRPRRRQSAL